MSFYYHQAHRVNGTMVPLEQDLTNMQDNQLIQIDIWMNEFLQTTVIYFSRMYSSSTETRFDK